ncbi:MAG: cell division protein FtsL [Gammaproteobacteria bacterium]
MEKQLKTAVLLLIGIVLSALALVVIKHQTRQVVGQLETHIVERDRIAIEWARLQLEEGARASHGMVERTARGDLQMYLPSPAEVRVLR